MARYSSQRQYSQDYDYQNDNRNEPSRYSNRSEGGYGNRDYDCDMRYGRSGIERNEGRYGENYGRDSGYSGNQQNQRDYGRYESSRGGYSGNRSGAYSRGDRNNYTGSDYGRGNYSSYDEDDYDSNYGSTRDYENRSMYANRLGGDYERENYGMEGRNHSYNQGRGYGMNYRGGYSGQGYQGNDSRDEYERGYNQRSARGRYGRNY